MKREGRSGRISRRLMEPVNPGSGLTAATTSSRDRMLRRAAIFEESSHGDLLDR